MPENNQILSVEGQLVGIPLQEYTAGPGIVVDNVNKTISASHWRKRVSNPFTASVANTSISGSLTIVDGIFAILSFNFNPMGKISIGASWSSIFTVPSAYSAENLAYAVCGGSEMGYTSPVKMEGNVVSMHANTSVNTGSRQGQIIYALATPVNEEDI